VSARGFAAASCLLIASLAVYLPSVRSGFVNWDDPQYVTGNGAELSAPLLSEFAAPSHGYYHPLTILSYKIDYRLGGTNPAVYHLTNTLLHTVNTLLLCALCAELGAAPFAAFCAALVFCVHPLLSEPVLWVSGRKDLLLCFFGLLSLFSYLRLWSRPRARIILASVFAALAMLAKPTGAAIPLMLLAVDYYKGREISRRVLAEKLPALAFGGAVLLASLSTGGPLIKIEPYKYGAGLHALSGLNNLWFYYRHIAVPAALSPDYPYGFVLGAKNLFLLPAAAAGISAAIVFSGRAGVLGGGIFLLGLLPVITRPEMAPADRYVYFPACGLALWLALLLSRAPDRSRRLAYALALCCAAAFAPQAAMRRIIWRGGESLWKDACLKYPCAEHTCVNYVDALARASRQREAIAVYENILSRGCALSGKAKNNLAYNAALAMGLDGRLDEAEAALKTISPDFEEYHQALNNFGMIELGRGNKAAARRYFESALKLKPDYSVARGNLKKV